MKNMTEEKKRVARISLFIILLLQLISKTYVLFQLDVSFLNRMMISINDMSFVFTIVCLSYIVYAIRRNELHIAGFAAVNIVVINRLYSNENLLSMWKKFLSFDKRFLFWAIIIVILFVIFVYKIKAKKKTTRNNDALNNVHVKENAVAKTNTDTAKKRIEQLEDTDKKQNEEKVDAPKEIKNVEQSKIKMVIMSACLLVIFWAVFDYLLYNIGNRILPIEINRPNLFDAYYEYIYYIAVFGIGVLFALSGIGMLKNLWIFSKKKFMEGDQESSFRLAVVLSIIAEFLLIVYSDKLKNIEIVDKFFNNIAENSVLSILSFIIVFIILLVIMTIVMHMITGNKDGDPMITGLTEKTKKIEAKLVMIGCNIIEGSLSIFDFIPDFFTTIGYVLFEIDIELLDIGQKDEKLEKNTRGEMNNKEEQEDEEGK